MIFLSSSEKMAAFIHKSSVDSGSRISDKVCRSRIQTLFDTDSFVSIDDLVVTRSSTLLFDRPQVEGDGVLTGYGTIGGRLVFAASQDPDVYGGSVGRAHAMKIVKVIEMAISSGAPFIALYSSGGARIEEGVLALEGFGAVLSALNNAKGQIPLISAIMGSCSGALALAAAKSDFIFFCEGISGLYLNSPSVTAALSGGKIKSHGIGNSHYHSKYTGLASFVLQNEEECLLKIRDLLDYIPVNTGESHTFSREMLYLDDPNRTSDRLNELASEMDSGLSIRDIFIEISDMQTFLEIGKDYGSDIVIALAKLDGITIGLIGNDALRLTQNGTKKASRFVRFCTQFMIPIVTFTSAEGFEDGADIDKSDTIESAGELISALWESNVPRISVIVGKAIGSAYLLMNSRMLGADMVFAWPTSQIAVISSDTAANILFYEEIAASEDPIAARKEKVQKYENEISDPEVAAGYGQVDEIILPSTTRPRLISALDILLCGYPLVDR